MNGFGFTDFDENWRPTYRAKMSDLEQLKKAISVLEGQRAVLGDDVVEAALQPMRDKLAALETEKINQDPRRKLVTVLFTDITGSTQMSQKLDPEDILSFLNGAMQRFKRVIEQHDGRVFRFMGDGLKAVFGEEITKEDDAERAVRAGLAILEESKAYAKVVESSTGLTGFNVRVGINTGPVVLGGGMETERSAMGMTVNLAARMESTAPVGGLRISRATYRHVRGLFETEEQPPLHVKGKDEPLITYLVTKAKPRRFHRADRGVVGIKTAMVGRESELALLQSAYHEVIGQSTARVITIAGEPGLGKTRLLYEFEAWLEHQDSSINFYRVRANQQLSKTPFGLLRTLFTNYLQIPETDSTSEVARKLEASLMTYFEEEAELKTHFIGALLGYDFSNSPYLAGIRDDPQQLKDRALFYLTQYFSGVTQSGTIALLLDDFHWADTPSLDAVNYLARECSQTPMLIINTARPILFEHRPDWALDRTIGDVVFTCLTVGALERRSCQDLVKEALQKVERIPETLQELIVSSAEGNPYYIEELINVLIDDGVIIRSEQNDNWTIDDDLLDNLRVPGTLTAVLQARLDNLNNKEKESLQQASVIGRVFWDSALLELEDSSEAVNATLGSLSEQELIEPQENSLFAGAHEYSFAQGLMREVTYETVLLRTRQIYHSQVASWLTQATESSGRSDEFAGVIADHFSQAGEDDEAIDWYIRAGSKTKAQGSPMEARKFFEQALEVLDPSDLERRWMAVLGHHDSLSDLGESEARIADQETLLALAQEMGDASYLAKANFRRAIYASSMGDEQSALPIFEIALSYARQADDEMLESLILSSLVVNQTRLGNLEGAELFANEVLARVEELGVSELSARLLTNTSIFYSEFGDIAKATQLNKQQVLYCQQIGNRLGEAIGLSNMGLSLCTLGLYKKSLEALIKSVQLSSNIGARRYGAFGQLNLGFVYWRSRDTKNAQSIIEEATEQLSNTGDRFGMAAAESYLALVSEQEGNHKLAVEYLKRAMHVFEELGAHAYGADAQAGLARNELALGHDELAMNHAIGLWAYLKTKSSRGMELPVLAYKSCADVFAANEKERHTQEAIRAGYDELMERAAKISDSGWRESYIENVPEHTAILRLKIKGDSQRH